ncbi:BLUF domain-containing protein [Palleronia abyssalis]|uniref:Blue light- and temperature-regulated antirepressor BluF n=1 Tax=Palleronia abyssalis TaxID=1501240 RepID=A0A2R8C1A9_9RHOB|nr:BLUF domain-containing protein [Palleronia abyssalis]SPJ26215.1 Blue light- and temperature-regulated antirepressor BluF [Palleronia abyssalis]
MIASGIARAGGKAIADLIHIIYASQPFGYDSAILSNILNEARACNGRDEITGALVCRQDIYLQLLEGPSEPVEAAYSRICRDDRHVGINKLVSGRIESRMFGNWAMLHDPARSLIWTQDQIADGILDRTPAPEIVAMFESVSRNARPEHQS